MDDRQARVSPRVIARIGGALYLILVIGFTPILAPGLANRVFPFVAVPAFVGELSLCLWLLVKGVNVER